MPGCFPGNGVRQDRSRDTQSPAGATFFSAVARNEQNFAVADQTAGGDFVQIAGPGFAGFLDAGVVVVVVVDAADDAAVDSDFDAGGAVVAAPGYHGLFAAVVVVVVAAFADSAVKTGAL